jgi:oligopeptide/dipeptide ABC transporter ATP-binding protein
MSGRLLQVSELEVTVRRGGLEETPVDGVSFNLEAGEILGLVGESGSGKTLTLRSIIGLLPVGGSARGDIRISLTGEPPTPYRPEEIRGRGISFVFQEPQAALNPTMRVGDLIAEGVRQDSDTQPSQVRARTLDLMNLVGIPDPERRARMWPHQLSGGLRQRIMIAAALSTQPRLLLCDEPTTALDVSIQDQILGLLLDLRQRLGMAIIFVTHDMAVIAELCDRIAVMYAGQIVETGPIQEVLEQPRHPYTKALLASVPSFHDRSDVPTGIPGQPPNPRRYPYGCRFAPRCQYVSDDCQTAAYKLAALTITRETACIHPERTVSAES